MKTFFIKKIHFSLLASSCKFSAFGFPLSAFRFKLSTLSSILFALCFSLFTLYSTAQSVSINSTGAKPDASAMLDVSSTEKGVLIPRVTRTQRNAITSPATGLMVFMTTDTVGFFFYNGTKWEQVGKTTTTAIVDSTKLADADNDTKVSVATTNNKIDFIQQDTTFHRFNSGQLEFLNTGQSVFIGENAGASDDLSTNSNTFIGFQTGQTVGTGSLNTAVGGRAMEASNNASDNVAVGYQALFNNLVGGENVAIGNFTLFDNTSGKNTAVGVGAAQRNSSGNNNVILGYQANGYNQAGSFNTILGAEAGEVGATHNKSGNVLIGYRAGFSNTTSNRLYIHNDSSLHNSLLYGEFDNKILRVNGQLQIGNNSSAGIAFSFPSTDGTNGQVLQTDGSGAVTWETLAGNDTLSIIQDADRNTTIQVEETTNDDIIRFDISGNERFLFYAGRIEQVGTGFSTYLGRFAGENDDFTNNSNTGIGYNSANLISSGNNNVALGYNSLSNNSSANNNVAVGSNALNQSLGGANNTAVGYNSMNTVFNGQENTGVGANTLNSNTNGSSNVAIGFEAINSVITSTNNTVIGHQALSVSTTATNNVIIGKNAGQNAATGNVMLGYQAGQNETGSNKLYIENSNSSTPLIWGDFTNDSLKINGNLTSTNGLLVPSGNVGVGTTISNAKLTLEDTTSTALRINTYGKTLAEASVLYATKTRGTESSPSALVANDELLRINAAGYDGNSYESVARIKIEVDGTPGDGDMPGRIAFFTTEDGTATNSERMRINNAGNVGIGTQSPIVPLHIDGGADASLASGGFLMIGEETGNNIVIDDNEIVSRFNGFSKNLWINQDGGDVYLGNGSLVVEDGGNVGIGKTPSLKLDVNGDISANGNNFFVTDSAGNNIEISGSGNATHESYGAYIRTTTNPPSGGSLFRVLSSGGAERFRVEHAGKVKVLDNFTVGGDVGIGTENPTVKFEVNTSSSNGAIALIENTNTGFDSDGLRIHCGPNSNPTGDAKHLIFEDNSGTDLGYIRGDGSGGVDYHSVSDRRRKTNIKDYQEGLSLIKEIKPRTYFMKSAIGIEKVGFIAQELQLAFPQAVAGDSTGSVKDNPMTVNYTSLVPVLTSAIKELHELVKNQQDSLNQQKSQLKEQEVNLDEAKGKVQELEAELKFFIKLNQKQNQRLNELENWMEAQNQKTQTNSSEK